MYKPISLLVIILLVATNLFGQDTTDVDVFPIKKNRTIARVGVQILGLSTDVNRLPGYRMPHYAHFSFVGWIYPTTSVPNGGQATFDNFVSFGAELSFMQMFVGTWGGSAAAFKYPDGAGGENVQTYRNPKYLVLGAEPLFFAWKINVNAGGGVSFINDGARSVRVRPILRARFSVDHFLSPTIAVMSNPIDQEMGFSFGVAAKF